MLNVFKEVVNGNIKDYAIKNAIKLEAVAKSLVIEIDSRQINDIAADLCHELEHTYTLVEGEIPFAKRVPPKTLETWRKMDIVPRGAMLEVMELLQRIHAGIDNREEEDDDGLRGVFELSFSWKSQ